MSTNHACVLLSVCATFWQVWTHCWIALNDETLRGSRLLTHTQILTHSAVHCRGRQVFQIPAGCVSCFALFLSCNRCAVGRLPGPLVNQKLTDGALWLMQHSMVGWLWPARAYTVLDVSLVLFCTVWVPFMKSDNIRWLSDTCQIRVNPCHMSQYLHWWGWLTRWHFLMGLTGALTP